MSLLGIDIGTSATKGMLLDDRGGVLASARRGYHVRVPGPERAEIPAARVWTAVRGVISELAAAGEVAGSPVHAVCVGGSGDEVVAVDPRGRAVAPVIMAADRRSDAEGRQLAETCGADELFRRTGLSDLATTPLARYHWMWRHQPLLAERVARLLSWPEWVMTCLGLTPLVDPTLAARTLAYDLARQGYVRASCLRVPIPDGLLSPVVPTGAASDAIPARVAGVLGLRPGTRYVVGGFDQAMATLGAGATEAGIVHDGNGSWEAVTACLSDPVPDLRLRASGWSVGPSATDTGSLEAMHSWVGGLAVRWVVGLMTGRAPGDRAVGRVLEGLPSDPARLVATTRFVTPGVSFGGGGAIVGLDLEARHPDLVLAVLDALVHRLRSALRELAAVGAPIHLIRATGGGSRSDGWLQAKADATGVVVERPMVAQTGAFAAAVLAGSAVGSLPPPADAVRALGGVAARFEPDPAAMARADERAGIHAELERALGGRGDGGGSVPEGFRNAGQ